MQRHRFRRSRSRSLAAACGAALAGLASSSCSPTYDWRETQLPDAAAGGLFPCKADRHARTVALAGVPVQMVLLSCATADTTFALSQATLPASLPAAAALAALRSTAVDNVGGTLRVLAPLRVAGLAQGASAEAVRLDGQRPDGRPLQVQAAFFGAGEAVYQASAVGSRLDAEALDTFFTGLHVAR